MTKIRIAVVTVALSFTTAAFCFGAAKTADSAASPAAAKAEKTKAPKKEAATMAAPMSPQMGTWKLNEAKSKISPGMGKNSTVIYAEKKDKITVTVDGTDKDGKPTHSVWTGKFDGKSYAVKGNMPYNSAAYTVVNDHTNNITAMKDGKLVWSGKISVAKDGKSRTVTVHGTDDKGKKFTNKVVYDKQ